ncbi:uncharacterized protein LOC124079396 isoform X2 [Marmota monax]|uniref:uncharacterized protein LOC124079396 isoform X2 n=1 Tax=Marmota monax TaxID=9995 RepID=UPI0026EDE08F|nr:uncharacterized protein LOC124079396 isoform X2 [Marmota monax]
MQEKYHAGRQLPGRCPLATPHGRSPLGRSKPPPWGGPGAASPGGGERDSTVTFPQVSWTASASGTAAPGHGGFSLKQDALSRNLSSRAHACLPVAAHPFSEAGDLSGREQAQARGPPGQQQAGRVQLTCVLVTRPLVPAGVVRYCASGGCPQSWCGSFPQLQPRTWL